MKGKKSTPKKASTPAKKSTPKKAPSPAKKSTPKKTVASAKKSVSKKPGAPAKKSVPKKALAPTKKKVPKKVSTPAKKNQAPESATSIEIKRLLKAVENHNDTLLDMDEDDSERDGIQEDLEICLIEILKLDPNNVTALILFAEFWLDRWDNLEDALEYLQRADKLSPKNKKIQTLIKDCQEGLEV